MLAMWLHVSSVLQVLWTLHVGSRLWILLSWKQHQSGRLLLHSCQSSVHRSRCLGKVRHWSNIQTTFILLDYPVWIEIGLSANFVEYRWFQILSMFLSSRCSNQTEETGSPIWAYNYCPTSYSWIVLMGLILYLAFFAPGMKKTSHI